MSVEYSDSTQIAEFMAPLGNRSLRTVVEHRLHDDVECIVITQEPLDPDDMEDVVAIPKGLFMQIQTQLKGH